jgi:hypothetical protein
LQIVTTATLDISLLPQGGWHNNPLKNLAEQLEGFSFGWFKHTNSSTENWGEQLHKNAQEVAKWKSR